MGPLKAITINDFLARMRAHRQNVEDFGRVIEEAVREHGDDGMFRPSHDADYWRDFERIEDAGRKLDETQAGWLAGLTQVNDLGPNGRAMFLASAALAALGLMPSAALAQGRELFSRLPPDCSQYRKVGVAKVLAASGSAEALPLLETLAADDHPYVQREAGWTLRELRLRLGMPDPAP